MGGSCRSFCFDFQSIEAFECEVFEAIFKDLSSFKFHNTGKPIINF